MSNVLSKSQLKPKLLDYLRKVAEEKKSLTVTDRGRPVARIVPYTENERDLFDELAHSVISYEDPLKPVGIEDWDL